MIKILLPMPISINQAYAGGLTHRYKSKAYKDWEKLCATYPQDQHEFIYNGRVLYAEYIFYSKWYNKDESVKMKDVSNYIKVVEDYLPNIINGFDDKYIFYATMKKHHNTREEVEITIKEI